MLPPFFTVCILYLPTFLMTATNASTINIASAIAPAAPIVNTRLESACCVSAGGKDNIPFHTFLLPALS